MPVKKRVVCAVDGGGSKTLAVVCTMRGKESARAVTGPSNYVAGEADRVVENVTAAVKQVVRATWATLPIEALWVGLAGIDRPGAREEIGARLAHLAVDVRLTNDAELLFGALDDEVGVVLIAGTGSIALGRDRHGNTARAGGWGYLIGDEGSGYYMGRYALEAASRSADGRDDETALLPAILAHWELDEPMQIIETLYRERENKALVAELAPIVIATALDGDEAAMMIVAECADQLGAMVAAVARKLDFVEQLEYFDDEDDEESETSDEPKFYDGDTVVPYVVAGSLLARNWHYRVVTEERLRQSTPFVRYWCLGEVEEPALVAAQSLAWNSAK